MFVYDCTCQQFRLICRGKQPGKDLKKKGQDILVLASHSIDKTLVPVSETFQIVLAVFFPFSVFFLKIHFVFTLLELSHFLAVVLVKRFCYSVNCHSSNSTTTSYCLSCLPSTELPSQLMVFNCILLATNIQPDRNSTNVRKKKKLSENHMLRQVILLISTLCCHKGHIYLS